MRRQAFNLHDVDALLRLYAEEIEIFTYPDQSLGRGKNHLEALFRSLFSEGTVQLDIHHQIAKDGYVVNHETVTYASKQTEYVSIYEVRNGLITTVRFVRD